MNLQTLQGVMNTELFREFVAVVLCILLFAVASYALSHSVTQAIKLMKSAFKNEFKTDAGRLNVFSSIFLVFIILFSNIDKFLAIALSPTHALSGQTSEIGPILFFCLFATGSLITVSVLEYKTEDSVKSEKVSAPNDPHVTPAASRTETRTPRSDG